MTEENREHTENPELEELLTHVNGAVNMHETRELDAPIKVERPVVPFPGPYDTRDGRFGDNDERPASAGVHAPLNSGAPRTPDVTNLGDLDTTRG
jgi:hypothetical protein